MSFAVLQTTLCFSRIFTSLSHIKKTHLFFLLALLVSLGGTSGVHAADPFPTYSCIKENVEFWKMVYAKYPSTKGFIHDSWHLGIIYEEIDLLSKDRPNARKINKSRIKKAKKKYRGILKKLARGERADSAEAKRVKALWGRKGSRKRLQEAANNVRFQHCISDRFQEGLARSGRYIGEMRRILQQYNIPVDLVYLPHVESSFNYKAYSKFGAAGIWQFIRSTGRRFLTIDYTLDERRDPIRATHAAARYLKENYAKLGDWSLALTAYNHGSNGMLRAKKKFGSFPRIYKHYDSKYFGFASRNFYAEFLAAREVARNYKKYFKGITIEPPMNSYEVELNGYFAINDLASFFKVPLTRIETLNPALRRPIYTSQKYVPKGYKMRLPNNKTVVALAAKIPSRLAKKEQKRSRFYRVERGDTAGKIAQRHKVKLRDLVLANNLDRRARIFVGQNLIIPHPGAKVVKLASLTKNKAVSASAGSSKVSGRSTKANAAKPHSTTKKTVAKTKKISKAAQVAKASPKKQKPKDVIVLAAAETVLKRKVAPATLASRKEPQVVAFDVEPQQAVEEADAVALKYHPEAIIGDFQVSGVYKKGGKKYGYIEVQAWETLGHYADWLGVRTRRIRGLNRLAFGRAIKTNQKIKIPLAEVDKELFEERRYDFHRGIEEDFFTAYKVVGLESYTVKRGDNIWKICHDELELPFWLLKKYNNKIIFDSLKPSQILVIPVIEKVG